MVEATELMEVSPVLRPLRLEGDGGAIDTTAMGWTDSGLLVRIVRGRKMRTSEGVFDEVSAALQFGLYFGENWDAFEECMRDLENLTPGNGIALIVTEPDQLLFDTPADEMRWLRRALEAAHGSWARPIGRGEWWDRPAVPFHVLFAGSRPSTDGALQRW